MPNHSFMSLRRDELKRRGDEEYRRKRQQVIDSAVEVFRAKGFQAARVADIAKQAGMDRATVYQFIASKEEVFQEVVQEAIVENVAMAEALKDDASPTLDRLQTLVHRLVGSYAGHYPYLFVYIQENMGQFELNSAWGRKIRTLSRRFADAVSAIVQEGIDDGSVQLAEGVPAHVVGYGIIGMCNWTHRWFDPAGPCSPDQIASAYAAMIIDGIRRK